ncbi:TetR/AcrR family transcriptional regulator [Nocardia sp. NEAU-G5]|uniref:TetR/AcrR family transcriptional regulator n=1 Tax=Nocardia albiluteola TaxID=2842303 RepID=A0ABS6AXE2_9NOCA|nr:TetR/AcrR family transcriptional regulator [Nocardia albiluteola]MBU3061663.1 TetR/AcrR family transcriptional regulator [Nocardia albiluteola]
MATSAEQGRETRARLMDAALELIAERGWSAVTTRLVAERAGLRPGLVHYHFSSVNDLLIDASLGMARKLGEGVLGEALAEQGAAGLEFLLATVGAYADATTDTRVFSEMLLAATRYERLRRGLREVLDDFRAAVASWLRDAGTAADPDATAAVLVAALDGLVLHRLIDPRLSELGVDGPLRRLTGFSDDGGTPQ